MVFIDIHGADAVVRKNGVLTTGMVGATAEFRFNEKWDGLAKTAVFRAAGVTKDAVLYGDTATIPHEVLQVPGAILEIGVYGTDNDNTVVIPTVWARTNPIRSGADPSGDESVEPTPGVWEQMQEQLNDMYKSSEEINAAKEDMLQAIEDGKAAINAAVDAGGYYTEGESGALFASAVKGSKSGAIVRADDVSPVEHAVKVMVHGRNLFAGELISGTIEKSDFSYYGNDNAVYKTIKIFLKAGVYTFSFGAPVNIIRVVKDGELKTTSEPVGALSYTVITNTDGYVGVSFRSSAGSTSVWDDTTPIQVEESDTATEYTPYIDPATVSVTRCGKNLLNMSQWTGANSAVKNSDGSITVTSTSAVTVLYVLTGKLPAGTYTLKNYLGVLMYLQLGTADLTKPIGVGSSRTFEYDGVSYLRVLYTDQSANTTVTYKAQLEVGSKATYYEAYISAVSYTPNADGSVSGVKSLSPTMTLLTDTPGAVLDVEYNRDTNVVIEELLGKIDSMISGTMHTATVE